MTQTATPTDPLQTPRQREEFIAVLAHELRNPIAPLRSGLDLLSSGRLDEAGRRKTLEMMQREVAHLVRLVDDLLDASRLSAESLQVHLQPTLLADVLASAVESIGPALAAGGQRVSFDPAGVGTVVDADPVRLSQVFTNIFSSSLRKTRRGGSVGVTVRCEAGSVTISIADGPAPDAPRASRHPTDATLPGIFDEGVVIGLGLVRGLVELHGGVVDAIAADGGGRAVEVVLPVSRSAPAVAMPPAGQAEANAWYSRRVLVVDDNEDAATTLSLLLEFDALTVRVAHDGQSAVSAAREWQPELIFMDIGLPGFSGIEATRQIRAARPAVRPYIVALTGWGTSADRLATAEAGCDLHLTKPVNYEKLRASLPALIKAAVAVEGNPLHPLGESP